MGTSNRNTSKKRDDILKAAMRAFREEGFESASMDRIAELAGASKRTVYNYFPSKKELFSAVLDVFVKRMISLSDIPYDPNRSIKEQLSDFIDAELSLFGSTEWLGLMKVLISVFIRDPLLAQDTMMKYGPNKTSFTHWLEAAQEDGKLKIENVELASQIFKSLVSGSFTWPAVFMGPIPEDQATVLRNEIIETFLARYGPG